MGVGKIMLSCIMASILATGAVCYTAMRTIPEETPAQRWRREKRNELSIMVSDALFKAGEHDGKPGISFEDQAALMDKLGWTPWDYTEGRNTFNLQADGERVYLEIFDSTRTVPNHIEVSETALRKYLEETVVSR